MPVLAPERSLLPNDLFSSDHRTAPNGVIWSVLHTKPRAEKALARWLVRHDVSFYLPLHERRQRVQRRLVCSSLPLFPGYVFLRGDERAEQTAFRLGSVVQCLRVQDQERLAADLARIHHLITSGAPLAPEERLQPGMAAEIVSGPLAGHRGTVLRRGGALRLVIEVTFLQRGASVEVETSMIRPL